MKKISTSFLAKGFMALTVCLILLSSCKKTETDTTPYTAVAVYNASPSVATYDVYLGSTRLNNAALPLGGGVAYSQQVAGSYDIKLTVAGRAESLYTKTVNLTQNNYHSFYLIGKPNAFDGIFLTDDLSATSTTNAFVRFVNLSPDAPALSLAITGGAAVATSQTYKGVSPFVQVAAGSHAFEVKDNGIVKATLAAVTLVANGHYTIFANGLITPTSPSEIGLGAQIVVNK